MSDYLWKLNNSLFKWFSWMYDDLWRYRGRGEVFIFVSDVHNTRIVILDLDLNWVNSFAVTASYALTGDSTYLYADSIGAIDKYSRFAPFTLDSSGATSTTNDIDSDDDYLYLGVNKSVGGQTKRYIQIYNKSDLTLADEFDTDLDGKPEGVTVDDTHIYCYGGVTTPDILKKFLKSDHSEVASVDVGDDGIYVWFGMDQDTDYIYFTAGATGNGELIAVYNKSDLTQYKTITLATTNYARDIAVYGDYAYQVDYGDHFIRKVKISDGSIVATFGEEGVLGTDTSHLQYPDAITVV